MRAVSLVIDKAIFRLLMVYVAGMAEIKGTLIEARGQHLGPEADPGMSVSLET